MLWLPAPESNFLLLALDRLRSHCRLLKICGLVVAVAALVVSGGPTAPALLVSGRKTVVIALQVFVVRFFNQNLTIL